MRESERRRAEGILCTDFYQLTMAQVYFRAGIHRQAAQFDHIYRTNPDYGEHQAGFCVNAGLAWLLDWMSEARFECDDLDFLRSLRSESGQRLFSADFLHWLGREGDFSGISIEAVPEGRVVHPHVPLTVVTGPLAMAQILETALLMRLNYQTLIATKAARIRQSGQGKLLLEFGTRRAHDKSSAAGVRAALIGGADFSSNTGVSCILDLPPKGTHAHSLVQAFMAMGGTELDAFRAYSEVYPDDCLLLVDTINTLESGMPNAIQVFQELRRKGHRPLGVRLDSGDLAYLSIKAARMLDAAGFAEARIVLSNQLDELVLLQIINQIREEAPRAGLDAANVIDRLVYGVGTRLITSKGSPALDGVYKLVALRKEGRWNPAVKISETPSKIPTPGRKQVWRIYDRRGMSVADLMALKDQEPSKMEEITLHHVWEDSIYRTFQREDVSAMEPLLAEAIREGKACSPAPSLEEIRQAREKDLARLDLGVKRLVNPHLYHVSLTSELWKLKKDLVTSARSRGSFEPAHP